jgi:integrase
MRRIVVTGLGAVTPLAADVEASWSRLLAGRSGIRRLPDDVVGDLPAKVGGVVPSAQEDPEAGFDPDAVLAPKDQRKVDRFILFALAAAEKALAQANWKPGSETGRLRTATIIASGIGGFLKALRQVFKYALEVDLVERNPARDVPLLRSDNPEGFHCWTPEELTQFEAHHPVGSAARLAFALLLYTAQRRSDVVRLGRQHLRDGWLTFTQTKNDRRNPVKLSIPIVPQLQAIIDTSPSGDLTFIVNEIGRPFSDAGFGNRFRKWCDEAGLPNCAAHGLRKASASRLAELGCSPHEIQAITGHRTLKEVERYTRAADQKRLAGRAMARMAQG